MRRHFRRRGHGRGNVSGKQVLGAGPERCQERRATWRPLRAWRSEGCSNSRNSGLEGWHVGEAEPERTKARLGFAVWDS